MSSTILTPEDIQEEQARAAMSREELEASLVRVSEIAKIVIARVNVLELTLAEERAKFEELKKHKKRRRFLKEQWFELAQLFDPEKATVLRPDDRAAMVGILEDMFIVTMPDDASHDDIVALRKYMRECGIKSDMLIIPESVGFVKLRPMTKDEQDKIQKEVEGVNAEETEETG